MTHVHGQASEEMCCLLNVFLWKDFATCIAGKSAMQKTGRTVAHDEFRCFPNMRAIHEITAARSREPSALSVF